MGRGGRRNRPNGRRKRAGDHGRGGARRRTRRARTRGAGSGRRGAQAPLAHPERGRGVEEGRGGRTAAQWSRTRRPEAGKSGTVASIAALPARFFGRRRIRGHGGDGGVLHLARGRTELPACATAVAAGRGRVLGFGQAERKKGEQGSE